ncbi:MAG TPA: hypothetical protein VGB55_06975 [Tepidisphaeraceae bacterium]|jgi:anti-sigma-K factor RskA
MKSFMLWSLVVLNVALGATLAGRHMRPNAAEAQNRRAGEYLTIPVDYQGARAGVVVVLDSTTGELSALITDEGQKKMSALPPMNMIEMFDKSAGALRRPTR